MSENTTKTLSYAHFLVQLSMFDDGGIDDKDVALAIWHSRYKDPPFVHPGPGGPMLLDSFKRKLSRRLQAQLWSDGQVIRKERIEYRLRKQGWKR